jgi:peptidoglycan hydrolase CwlO-like protein
MTLTPEQFNKLATKDDLDEVKNDVGQIKKDVSMILTAVDNLTKIVTDFQAEMASNQAAHDRFEYRISKLESKESIVRDEEAGE